MEDRPILQKGDNFTVAGNKPQRYVQQSLSAKDAASPPTVRFVMERLDPVLRGSACIAFDGGCLQIDEIAEIHATLLPADFDP